jgi:photosystem II stability/assembly factor-like uncharacterized protein
VRSPRLVVLASGLLLVMLAAGCDSAHLGKGGATLGAHRPACVRRAGNLCVTRVIDAIFPPPLAKAAGPTFLAAAAASPTEGYVAGEECDPVCTGLLAVTNSAGARWRLDSTGHTLVSSIMAASRSVGFALGSRTARSVPGEGSTYPCGASGLSLPCTTLLRTTDSGRRWSALRAAPHAMVAAAFSSASDGVVAVDSCASTKEPASTTTACKARLERTTDGGMRWTTAIFTVAPVVALATEAGELWAVEAHAGTFRRPGWLRVIRSADGGARWSASATITLSEHLPVLAGIAVQLVFASERYGGMVISDQPEQLSEFLTTADGGASWAVSSPPPPAGLGCGAAVGSLAAAPGHRLVVDVESVGECPTVPDEVDATSDGGRSWSRLRTFAFGPVLVSVAIPGQLGWAAGRNGILRTTNGGATWAQVLPAPVPVDAIDFVSPSVGFGAGTVSDSSVLLATTDGGHRWHQVADLGAEFVAIAFSDARDGWAIVSIRQVGGGPDDVVRTTDGGATWRATSELPGGAGPALAAASSSAEPIFADSPEVATVVVPQSPGFPSGSCEVSGSTTAKILSTTDGGRTWRVRVLAVPGGGLVAAAFARGGRLWAITGAGVPGCSLSLHTSRDDGVDWVKLGEVPTVGREAPASPSYGLDPLSAGAGLLWLSRQGTAAGQPEILEAATGLLATSDEGRTWTEFLLPKDVIEGELSPQGRVGLGPTALQFLPGEPEVGWMVTTSSFYESSAVTLWHTLDGGRHWTAVG